MWDCGNWLAGSPVGMGHFFMGLGPFGGLFGILLFLIIGYLIFKFIQSLTQKSRKNTDKNHSLTLLKTRLAEGAISQEEYKRIKEVLLR